MKIEERLESIDSTLKGILQALLSGGTAIALLGTPDAAASAEKKPRTKKEKDADNAEGYLDEDPAGTRYWITSDGTGFHKSAPGAERPNIPHLMAQPVRAAEFAAKRDEHAKKSSAAGTAGKTAQGEPSATAQADTAAGTSQPDFKAVVEQLMLLSTTPAPKGGKPVLMNLIASFLPAGTETAKIKVPALEHLGKNAEIIAAVKAILEPAPEAAAEDDDPFA